MTESILLREIPATRQLAAGTRRRWFTSANIDLFVWLDAEDSPTGFQLCYDKQHREHALTWSRASGFSHMAVDGGESRAARYKGAPILVANGSFDAHRILEEFRRESRMLPPAVVRLVEDLVGEFAGQA